MNAGISALDRPPPSWRVPALFAAITFLLHLAFYQGYGYFRDELYFIACSRNLDWGYVDQPPGVAVLAWISRLLLGESLFAIRLFPMLVAALQVLLAGLTARAMGGGRGAQALASIGVMAAPIYFGSYLSTDIFMTLGWAACAWVAARIFAGASPRLWLLFGLFAGLALEGKHAMVFFGVAFLAGLALTGMRKHLAERWFWLGGALAFLLASPNLAWEVRHHWATWELLSNISASSKNIVLGPGEFLVSNIVFLGPVALPFWAGGLAWCFFSPGGRAFRPLAWTWLLAYLAFALLKGKGYYLAPAYTPLFAAGAVAIESWGARPSRERLRALIVPGAASAVLLGGMVLWPFAMPMMPVETFIAYEEALHIAPPRTETMRLGRLPQQYADMFGWPELASAVAKAYQSIPPGQRAGCGIFAQNYGEAGAIDFFGRDLGLPPVLSGHQNYWLWGPRGFTGQCLVVVGDHRERLEELFTQVEKTGETDHPYAIPYENHLGIWIVRGPKFGSLQELWPQLKHWM
jgi:hypothetical protein